MPSQSGISSCHHRRCIRHGRRVGDGYKGCQRSLGNPVWVRGMVTVLTVWLPMEQAEALYCTDTPSHDPANGGSIIDVRSCSYTSADGADELLQMVAGVGFPAGSRVAGADRDRAADGGQGDPTGRRVRVSVSVGAYGEANPALGSEVPAAINIMCFSAAAEHR